MNLEPIEARMKLLLNQTAEVINPCKACNVVFYFVRHRNARALTPYTEAGVNHLIDCPQAARFRKPKIRSIPQ